jgi:hypothetical protein
MTIPKDVIKFLETEVNCFEYGEATLTVHRRGSNIRYTIGRERTFLHDTYLKEVDEPYVKNNSVKIFLKRGNNRIKCE